MTAHKPINIVGGGLAGLTLGIGLRQRGLAVVVWEAGHYPRHRVCGEFISGRGQRTLARLGLRESFDRAGAILARTAAFFSTTAAGRAHELPNPALCLPRFQVDALLAARFREFGGDLREGERWRDGADYEGVVLASGRRLHPVMDGWRWFGFKSHAVGVSLSADLEMHVAPDGYVGLCRQPGGVVNVCGLFRRRAASGGGVADWQEPLRGAPGSLLRQRMANATFVAGSFCAVAGINLKPQSSQRQSQCRIGDAITMTPPLTGNGMSMALESAEAAIEPLLAWSQGEIPWAQTQQIIASQCDAIFARRLTWAKWLQRLILVPALQDVLVKLALGSKWFWSTAFERTR